jgi:hypothetical protein
MVQLDGDESEAKYGKVSTPGKRKKSKKSVVDDEENGAVCFPTYCGDLILIVDQGNPRPKNLEANLRACERPAGGI